MKRVSKSEPHVPSDEELKQAWDWVCKMRAEWTQTDWADFYHGIAFAFWKIRRRHMATKPPINDYEI